MSSSDGKLVANQNAEAPPFSRRESQLVWWLAHQPDLLAPQLFEATNNIPPLFGKNDNDKAGTKINYTDSTFLPSVTFEAPSYLMTPLHLHRQNNLRRRSLSIDTAEIERRRVVRFEICSQSPIFSSSTCQRCSLEVQCTTQPVHSTGLSSVQSSDNPITPTSPAHRRFFKEATAPSMALSNIPYGLHQLERHHSTRQFVRIRQDTSKSALEALLVPIPKRKYFDTRGGHVRSPSFFLQHRELLSSSGRSNKYGSHAKVRPIPSQRHAVQRLSVDTNLANSTPRRPRYDPPPPQEPLSKHQLKSSAEWNAVYFSPFSAYDPHHSNTRIEFLFAPPPRLTHSVQSVSLNSKETPDVPTDAVLSTYATSSLL